MALTFLCACDAGSVVLDVPRDQDGDGFAVAADCDDADALRHPGAAERCNEVDDDCDGVVDASTDAFEGAVLGHPDRDGDERGAEGDALYWCPGTPIVSSGDDCDDTRADVAPGQPETCNERDDDCNGLVDGLDPQVESGPGSGGTFQYVDVDVDGVGSGAGAWVCPGTPRWAAADGDCAPDDPYTFPGAAAELGAACATDRDRDGWGDINPPAGATPGTDCDDQDAGVSPSAFDAPYDGVDVDCNEANEWDADGDGHNVPTAPLGGDDCLDSDPLVFPGSPDVPGDGIDQDCSGIADDCVPGTVACPVDACNLRDEGLADDAVTYLRGRSGSAIQVPCSDALDGGGWALAATVSRDGKEVWSWANARLWRADPTLIGDPSMVDHDLRTGAFFDLPFRDLLFVHEPSGVWAAYHDVGDGRTSFGELSEEAELSWDRCYRGAGFPLSAGTLTLTGPTQSLCNLDLYLHPLTLTSVGTCSSFGAALGPSWTGAVNRFLPDGCPFTGPGFMSTLGVWVDAGYADAEYGVLGFGGVLGLNVPAGVSPVHMKMYVR